MRHPSLEPAVAPAIADSPNIRWLVGQALKEDAGGGDVTTLATIPKDARASGRIVFRADGVAAGIEIAALAFKLTDGEIKFESVTGDGSRVTAGTTAANVSGPARGILTAERVALNYLARLSGIATLTRAYVDAVDGLPARIADTRKTTPSMRELERYAVRMGGGFNHRRDLGGAVLIKDNHAAVVGSVAKAVALAKARVPANLVVEAECDTLDQVKEALAGGADAVLLDNMNIEDMREAVGLARGRAAVEASGNVTLERVRAIAETGVDVISVGALTHAAPWLDVGLDFEPAELKSGITHG